VSKLADDFSNERTLLVTCSGLLIGICFFGTDVVEKLPFFEIKIPSKELAIPILIALVLYFSLRLMLEWHKSDKDSRALTVNKIDFYVTILIAISSTLKAVFELTHDQFFWDLPLIATAMMLFVGEFVANTTSINIENISYIRSKDESLKLGLPRLPVAVRATLIFIPFNVIILSTTSIAMNFYGSEPLKSNWYWVIIFPMLIHSIGLFLHFLFPNKEMRSSMKTIFEQHDAAYQVGGWDQPAQAKNSKLYQTTERGLIDDVKRLLEQGYDPDEKNRLGWTPFLLSVANGDSELVGTFLEYGADVNVKNSLGRTGIHFVCKYGFLEIGRKLIAADANVNLKDTGHNGIPLHMASQNGFAELVSLLLDNGADVDAKDFYGKTALEYAQEHGFGEISKILRVHKHNANKSMEPNSNASTL
jgi:hypothetical protein